MRKSICYILVVAMLVTNAFAFAEQKEDRDIFSSIGGFLSDTINNAGETIDSAVNDASGYISGVTDGIGDALTNAGENIEKFWDSTSGYVSDAWNWAEIAMNEAGSAIGDTTQNTLNQLGSWLDISGDNALNTLKGVYNVVTSSLGIAENKATDLWNGIYQYSIEKNINMVVLVKLALAIMIRISLGGDILIGEMAGDYIDQVVMDWFTDFSINNETDAENALTHLEDSLGSVVSDSNN